MDSLTCDRISLEQLTMRELKEKARSLHIDQPPATKGALVDIILDYLEARRIQQSLIDLQEPANVSTGTTSNHLRDIERRRAKTKPTVH